MASVHHWHIPRRGRCLGSGGPSWVRRPVLSGADFLGCPQQRQRTPLPRGSASRPWIPTTMSCSLPPELLDIIVDHLRDEPAALKACCIVSKSWISRSRIHLFAHIRLDPPMRSVELWKQTFPDPSNSLARYARTISFLEPESAALVNPDVMDWIRSFHYVENLFLNLLGWGNHKAFLVQLCGFSSALRSLCLEHSVIPLSKIFNFISSFLSLEDLSLITTPPHTIDTDKWISPSTSPKFTGPFG